MLRLFYVVYFMAVAVVQPYFPPYLRALGLGGRQISFLLVAAPILHLAVPLGWGWLADRTRRPDLFLRVACAGACVLFVPLLFVRTLPAMIAIFAAHQAFAVAIGGLADSLALERVRQGADYGRIRLWGSLSYAVTSGVMGLWLAARAVRGGDPIVPLLIVLFLAGSFAVSLTLRGQGGREPPHARDVWILLRDRRFLVLLLMAPLHWAALAPYHGFFAILLQDRGISPAITGKAILIGAVGEMLALYWFGRLRRRLSVASLFAVSFAASVVRWALVAFVHHPVGLAALQALHALTFGMFLGCVLAWLGACVPPKLRATGQTLYTAATFGLGNILGVLGTGAIYDYARGAGPAFAAAALLELVPLALALTLGRRLDPAPARLS